MGTTYELAMDAEEVALIREALPPFHQSCQQVRDRTLQGDPVPGMRLERVIEVLDAIAALDRRIVEGESSHDDWDLSVVLKEVLAGQSTGRNDASLRVRAAAYRDDTDEFAGCDDHAER